VEKVIQPLSPPGDNTWAGRAASDRSRRRPGSHEPGGRVLGRRGGAGAAWGRARTRMPWLPRSPREQPRHGWASQRPRPRSLRSWTWGGVGAGGG